MRLPPSCSLTVGVELHAASEPARLGDIPLSRLAVLSGDVTSRSEGLLDWAGVVTAARARPVPGSRWSRARTRRFHDPDDLRGKGVKARGLGAPVAKLASWLRGRPGVDVVTLEAFPVEPAAKRLP